MTSSKPFWKSRTVWVNLVALIAALSPTIFGFEIEVDVQAEIVAGIMAVVNIVLRFVTRTGVGL